jgi:nucleoside-diphosphate-sugar epimerase
MNERSGILVTGFPGFIAGRLLRRLVDERPDADFYLLVEPRFCFVAKRACERLEAEQPELRGRWQVVTGDIRHDALGIDLESQAFLRPRVRELWHLAAIYDLAVPQSIAYAVNVDGTDRVLDFCESLPDFERLQYVSTCYVAGERTGRIFEDELDCGQEFKNHYESTKFWAEARVRRRMSAVPSTIYRPAIVVGDSTTGETLKGDGPYAVVQLLDRLPRWLPFVHVGRSDAPVNVVPVDFVVEAMVALSSMDAAVGGTFALADPTPLPARDFLELTLDAMNRAPALGRVPPRAVERVLGNERARDALGLTPESLAYFNHPATFDVSNTARLLGDDLHCPRVDEYWPRLIDYARNNPQIFSARP